MFNTLLADSVPEHTIDVIMMPAILFLASLAIWYFGVLLETKYEIKNVKWGAAIPVLAGLVMGIGMVMRLVSDPIYNGLVTNDRLIQMHYVSLILPIAAAGILVAWQIVLNRRQDSLI